MILKAGWISCEKNREYAFPIKSSVIVDQSFTNLGQLFLIIALLVLHHETNLLVIMKNLVLLIILISLLWLVGYYVLAIIMNKLLHKLHTLNYVTKIQHGIIDKRVYQRELKYSFISCLIFAVFTVLIYQMYQSGVTKLYTDWHYSDILLIPLGVLFYVIVQDAYFYWMHRLLHVKYFMKRFHAIHHLSHQPSTYTTYSLHPVEAIFQVLFLPILPLILPMHVSALIIFIFFYQLIVSMLGHSGYEFYKPKFKTTWIGKFCNTPVYHDFHHKRSKGNFGLYFNFWDKLMKTYYPASEKHFYSSNISNKNPKSKL